MSTAPPRHMHLPVLLPSVGQPPATYAPTQPCALFYSLGRLATPPTTPLHLLDRPPNRPAPAFACCPVFLTATILAPPPPLLPSPHSAALPHMLRMLSYFPYCTGLSGAAKAPGSQPQPPPCTLFSLGTLIMCILLSVTPGADTGLAHCEWSRIGHR